MAEPARRYDPDIEPDIRPNLRVVQGGGDSSSGRGNLSSVSNDTADSLRNREAASNSNVYDISSGRKLSPDDAATRNSDDVSGRESNPNPNWATNLSIDKKKKDAKAQAKAKKKKALALIGVGGVSAGILAAFMFLLPLKLEAFYENILKHAEAVPQQAIEHRTEYLVTRVIAARAASVAGFSKDADLLFCSTPGNIACSLFKTYTTDFIEKRYGLKMVDEPGKPGVVDFQTTKRSGLGGNGYKWEVTYKDVDVGGLEKTYSKTFTNNKEAYNFIKEFVNERMPSEGGLYDRMKGVITRYIARKVVMKKAGVTRWTGWRKASEKITDLKSKFGSAIIRNTVGLASDKFSIAVACFLASPQTCEKTVENISPDSETAQKLLGESSDEVVEGAEKLTSEQVSKIITTLMEKSASKMASKAIPILGYALLYDMYAHMVLALNDGTVDKIVSEMVEGVYMAYAFGNDAGIVTNIDKLKAGDLDMNTLSVMSDMFDGAEKSPLYAAENGVTNTAMATMFGGSAYAASGSDNGGGGVTCPAFFGTGTTGIPKGEMVCPNQQIDRNITGFLHGNNPIALNFQTTQVPAATAWVHSGGYIADGINWLIEVGISLPLSLIKKIPRIDNVMSAVGSAFGGIASGIGSFAASLAGQFLSGSFGIPPVGIDATGDQNYTGLSGGIRAEANETTMNGQDADGTPSGIGGRYLTPNEVTKVVDSYNASQPQPSYLASLFSPDVEGSLTQQFALLMPTSTTDIISSLLNGPSAILASLSHPTFAADSGVSTAVADNPFHLATGGYPVDDPAFTANPNTYTPEYCQQTAEAWENSFALQPGVSYKVPTVTDPCALEKSAVGGALIDANNTTDPNSLKDPAPIDGSGSDTTQNPSTGNSSEPYGDQDPKQIAQQLLPYISSGKISCSTTQASNCPEIQDVAKGVSIKDSTCAVDALRPELLGVLLTAAKAGNTFTINAICKGHGIIKTAANPQGWTMHPLGDAADIGVINGQSLWGSTNISKITPFYTAINAVYKPGQILYNQYECHANMSVFDGYKEGEVGDACNHQHLQTDTTTAIDAIPPGPSNWSGPKPSWWTG